MSKQILPDYIVRQDAVQAKVEEAKAMIESANNHLAALKKEDIPKLFNKFEKFIFIYTAINVRIEPPFIVFKIFFYISID